MKRKCITQCTDIQNAIAFALIRLGKISGRRRPGTGPAPTANDNTNLKQLPREMNSEYNIDVI